LKKQLKYCKIFISERGEIMKKAEFLYNKILELTMVAAIISLLSLIINLFYGVTRQAIDCSGNTCVIDSSETFFKITIWMLLVLLFVFAVISRIMLFLLTTENKLEDVSTYKSRAQSKKEDSLFFESKLEEMREQVLVKKAKEQERALIEVKQLEKKAKKEELKRKSQKNKLNKKGKNTKIELQDEPEIEVEQLEEVIEVAVIKEEVIKEEVIKEEVIKEEEKVIKPDKAKPAKPKQKKKTKADIIEYIEIETGLSKNKSNKFLKFFAEVVKEELAKGKDVNLTGFGMFTTIKMPAKEAVNPQTNQKIIVPAHNQARLRFDDNFKKNFEVK
jgi:nucleoid DNA-binding protein